MIILTARIIWLVFFFKIDSTYSNQGDNAVVLGAFFGRMYFPEFSAAYAEVRGI
jgi:hypothetical protein